VAAEADPVAHRLAAVRANWPGSGWFGPARAGDLEEGVAHLHLVAGLQMYGLPDALAIDKGAVPAVQVFQDPGSALGLDARVMPRGLVVF